MTPLLSIKNLNKTLNNFQFGPIDLTIEPGTITALVGNNGSGKSTLLKLIMQLIKPDSGSIQLANEKVTNTSDKWKQYVAYQPQTVDGYHHFTGKALKSLIATWYPHWDEQLFQSMVHQLDIPLTKRIGTLSQGVQQKLLMALTLPRQTNLLLLDEPTTFIDIPSRKILIDFLIDWMEIDGRALIITSHQVEDIKRLSDYICVLKDGHVAGHFVKENLTENYQRYWINDLCDQQSVPGEVCRDGNTIISNQPQLTEAFLQQKHVSWQDRSTIELEDIISILLTNKKG